MELAATLRLVGARGWSLRTLAPARWQAVLQHIRRNTNCFASVSAWEVALSVPDIPPDEWSVLMRSQCVSLADLTPYLFDRLLHDPRLSAVDRRALVAGPAGHAHEYGSATAARCEPLPWQLPGALDGLCDATGRAGHEDLNVPIVRAIYRTWAALGGQERPTFWARWAEVVSPGRTALMDALWTAHQRELIGDPDAMSALLGLTGQVVRVEIIMALASPGHDEVSAPRKTTGSTDPAPTRTGRSS